MLKQVPLCNAPSQIVSTFSYRLQVVEEIEILTSSPLLKRYNRVWQNAHWFEKVQTIYPDNETTEEGRKVRNCPSPSRLEGAKSMQESLLLYIFEAQELTAGNPTKVRTRKPPSFALDRDRGPQQPHVSAEFASILDICFQLLDAAKPKDVIGTTKSDFQASIKRKY